MHDWDGLTGYEVKRANMLAELGYSVFAADLFGAGVWPTENKDNKQHTGEPYKDRAKLCALMNDALSEAGALGGNAGNAVAVGYCFGGAATIEMARSGADLRGFVTLHGELGTLQGHDYSKARGRYLILHGSADKAISMDQFASLTNQLEAESLEHEMVTFSGAPHAFTVFDSTRYREDADRKSWALFGEYLGETLN